MSAFFNFFLFLLLKYSINKNNTYIIYSTTLKLLTVQQLVIEYNCSKSWHAQETVHVRDENKQGTCNVSITATSLNSTRFE